MRWFLFIFAGIILLIAAHFAYGDLTGSLDEKSIEERLKPDAEVNVVGGAPSTAASETPKAAGDIGQQRYDETCKMCHATGLAGAPKFGDKGDWAPRVKLGIDELVKNAIQGIKAMPPKGGCSSCSDEEIRKAVEYMVNHSK